MVTKPPMMLPNEVWKRILDNLNKEQDLPDAWLSCRHVSTGFKVAVESNFRDRHLPKTQIVFYLGTIYNDEDERVVLNCSFGFDRLSEDKNVAIFRMEPPEERYYMVLRSHLRKALEDTLIDKPVHTVQVRRRLNDTPLPELSIDYEKWELSCDWRGVYTSFFGEEQLYNKYKKEWAEDNETWTSDIQEQVIRGEIDMVAAIEKVLYTLADSSNESRKMARRARVRRQYRQHFGFEYDFEQHGSIDEEKALLEELGQLERLLLLQEYSDDEDDGEGSEDEADPDPNEDDGWEDEDEGHEDAEKAEI